MTSRRSDPAVLHAICSQGMALHQAGRLQEAADLYNKVLAKDARHFEALHLLGMAYAQAGRPAIAVDLLKRAIRVNPGVPATHAVLGGAFYALERHTEALASYERSIALQPDAETYFNRGVVLGVLGRPLDAVDSYDRAIALRSRYPEAWCNRGLALQACGRREEAVASHDRAIALNANLPEPHHGRGQALADLGRLAEAIASYDRAIAVQPSHAEAHHHRGTVLERMAAPGDALASYDRAIGLQPDSPAFHDSRASALFALNRHGEALTSYDKSIGLEPSRARPYNGRGTVLTRLGRPDAALENFEVAARLAPDDAEVHNNRAVALRELGRHEEALVGFERAIALNQDFSEARGNRAHLLLLMGRFDPGWRAYEWRNGRLAQGPPSPGEDRRWRGETNPAGKILLVKHEQGLGDTIQFCRYVQPLQERGANVVLSAQRPLRPLLRQLGVTILEDGEPAPRFDHYCPLLSLPLALGFTPETIPSRAGYLAADDQRRARFEAILGPRVRPRVGLAWSGSPAHKNDHNRSLTFARLARLLSPGVDWICLQDTIRPEDARAFADSGRAAFLGPHLADFADTAGLVDLMDLVITVDTSIAHLAGAMGKPVWILLPFTPDWRWLLGRDDSPWYASARLFRQPAIGDWESVLGAVGGALATTLERAGETAGVR